MAIDDANASSFDPRERCSHNLLDSFDSFIGYHHVRYYFIENIILMGTINDLSQILKNTSYFCVGSNFESQSQRIEIESNGRK
mmetsp:Transcript_47003/g.52367  ORF Transcript_47003/g.52367 Transcript_47003/m.52367 type:complete len:83 (+) Transcript_47003:45-293(+)